MVEAFRGLLVKRDIEEKAMLKKFATAKEVWFATIERSNKCKQHLATIGYQVGVMQHGGEERWAFPDMMPIVILWQEVELSQFVHLFILLSKFRSSLGLPGFILKACIPFLVCHGTFQFLLQMHRKELQPRVAPGLVETEWNLKTYSRKCNKKWWNSHGRR
jgi:hypothetical protein